MVKKAQLKIQQMAFMILAVFIFFILVGLFAFSFKFSGLKKTAEELGQKQALLLASKLAESPEFSCGQAFGNQLNCIDKDKVLILKENIDKYSPDFWGISNIYILRFFGNPTKECSRGGTKDCGYIDLFSKGIQGVPLENFITLCEKTSEGEGVYDKCEIAKLIIYTNE